MRHIWLILGLVGIAFAQDTPRANQNVVGRYQLIAATVQGTAPSGGLVTTPTIFRIDTVTGRVSQYRQGIHKSLGYYEYMIDLDEYDEWKAVVKEATERGVKLPGTSEKR